MHLPTSSRVKSRKSVRENSINLLFQIDVQVYLFINSLDLTLSIQFLLDTVTFHSKPFMEAISFLPEAQTIEGIVTTLKFQVYQKIVIRTIGSLTLQYKKH